MATPPEHSPGGETLAWILAIGTAALSVLKAWVSRKPKPELPAAEDELDSAASRGAHRESIRASIKEIEGRQDRLEKEHRDRAEKYEHDCTTQIDAAVARLERGLDDLKRDLRRELDDRFRAVWKKIDGER